MNFSEFAIRTLFLLMPGLISIFVIRFLTSYKENNKENLIFHVFILGFISYIFCDCLISLYLYILKPLLCSLPNLGSILLPITPQRVTFFNVLLNPNISINNLEVLLTCVIASCIGIVISFLINTRYLNKFLRLKGLTKQTGPYDIWNIFFNQNRPSIVMDFENKLAYSGWIYMLSDDHINNELVLRDVIVYNLDENNKIISVEIDCFSAIYISRKSGNITIANLSLPETNYRDCNKKKGD